VLAPVVFDMDGVLADSEPVYQAAFQTYLSSIGREDAAGLFALTLGRRPAEFMPELADVLGRPAADVAAGMQAAFAASNDIECLEPMPYAAGVIGRLATEGRVMAVASSSSREFIDAALATLGLARHFSAVASGDDVRRGKPDPEIFLLAAQRLRVEATACIAVEDSPAGIEAAAAAGMFTVAVPNGYTKGLDFSRADELAPDLLSAYELICQRDTPA
jgi:HAD superfamily hydrolase (TIGR01509 family)